MSSAPETGNEDSTRVLIVDDDDLSRIHLRALLPSEGIEVTEVSSGQAALEHIKRDPVDMVLLDVRMPGLDGVEVCERLRSDEPLLPIIFITGLDDRESRLRAMSAGADDFLTKPVDQAELMVRMTNLLRIKAHHEAAEERIFRLSLQNAELARLKHLRAETGEVLKQLGDSEHGFMADFERFAEQFINSDDKSTREMAQRLVTAGRNISGNLASQTAATSESPKSKNVLIIDGDRATQRLTERSVRATGANVATADNKEDALRLMQAQHVDALFVNWDNLSLVENARQLQPSPNIVLTTGKALFEDGAQLPVPLGPDTSVLARTQIHDSVAVRELVTTAGKLLSGDLFGLDKYMGWGSALGEHTLTHSDQRAQAVDAVFECALHCRLRKTMANKLATLADELLMNAIWDAPANEDGKAKYNHLSRKEPIALESNEVVTLRYGMDGNLFGLSVTDAFGRLDHEIATRYLTRCFSKGADQIQAGSGGAGLGLYLAYSTVSSFVINVDPGKKTEVIGLVKLQRSQPSTDASAVHSFCYFQRRKAT